MYILRALRHLILAIAFSDAVQPQAQLIFNPPLSEVELQQLHNISAPLSTISTIDIVSWPNKLPPNSTVLDNTIEHFMQLRLLDVLSSIYNYITSNPDTIHQVGNARNHPRNFKITTVDMIGKSVGGLQPRSFSSNTTLQNGNANNRLHNFDPMNKISKEVSPSQETNTNNTAAKKRSLFRGLLAGLISFVVVVLVSVALVLTYACCAVKGMRQTCKWRVYKKPMRTVYIVPAPIRQRQGSLPPAYPQSVYTLRSELGITYQEALRDPVPDFLEVMQEDHLNALIHRAIDNLIVAARGNPAGVQGFDVLRQLIGQRVPEGGYRARVEHIESLYSSMLQAQNDSILESVVEEDIQVNSFENAVEREATEQLGAEQLATEQLGTEQLGTEQLGTEQLGTEQLETEQLATEQLATEQLATEQLATEQLATEQLGTEQGRNLSG
ncbi:hypothetical protein OCU04_011448 [Sclerotinia nivalis]|uniref:Uncharacterized protein n=1 Tax=Sclerotinia nivalis TaxID=352851 RepID=A0A9X0ABR8_9HELO|nr:hypothetical protein OCU04_011448 [Sclerotinia nivalis]